jgi:hypothetical protein
MTGTVRPLRPPDPVGASTAAQSDLHAVTDVLDRLTRHRPTRQRLTPKREAAARALRDLMPELVAELAAGTTTT